MLVGGGIVRCQHGIGEPEMPQLDKKKRSAPLRQRVERKLWEARFFGRLLAGEPLYPYPAPFNHATYTPALPSYKTKPPYCMTPNSRRSSRLADAEANTHASAIPV